MMRQRKTKGWILHSSGPQLLCMTAAILTAVRCMWCLSEFIRSLVDHKACLGRAKPWFLYIRSSGLSSLPSPRLLSPPLPVFIHSSHVYWAPAVYWALCWVVAHSDERKSSGNSSHGARSLVGKTNIKSVNSWSAPRWWACSRPSINIHWLTRTHTNVLGRKKMQCGENTVHIGCDHGACNFAMGQRWMYIRHFKLEFNLDSQFCNWASSLFTHLSRLYAMKNKFLRWNRLSFQVESKEGF